MCGILFTSKIRLSKTCFYSALETMNHRGPDNIDYKKIDYNFFGHVRLSIIDLNKRSNQPFHSGNYVIIYNGEVYNYKELIIEHKLIVKTGSDTEVILEMYKKYDNECLKHFNGMFSFIIYNAKRKTIFVARDRLGIKPLYYFLKDDKIIISSEIEAITKLIPVRIDKFGIRQYKKLRMTIKGHTFYKNIKQFPPGNYFDGKSFFKYWDLDVNDNIPPKDGELDWLIRDSVKLRKRSDVAIGSYLSGGLDSTILSYILKPQYTWTVGFRSMNEFKWSSIANKNLKSIHTKVLIDYDEFIELGKKMIIKRKEPLSVPNEILIYKMNMEVKKKNTVVLSGEGADELFWGYDRIFKWARVSKKILLEDFDKYYCYGSQKDDEVLDFALENLPGKTVLQKIAYFFQVIHLQGLLRRLDNSSMLCSIEARVPFVDHRLIEMMAGVPFKWRMGSSFKEPLKRIYKDFIPKEIIKRPKIGFPVPLNKIFKKSDDSTFMDSWLNFNLNNLK